MMPTGTSASDRAAPTDFVATVSGSVTGEDLGWVLPHEHLVTSSAGVWDAYPELIGDLVSLESRVEAALRALTETPIRTLVDLTTHDLGRNVTFLQKISSSTGINIVAATGCWLDAPRSFTSRHPDEIAALFIRELTDGIGGTGIRAGVIKVANEGDIAAEARTIFLAAGLASAQCAAPIYTHSRSLTHDGFKQLEILIEAGADPNRICIGHCNDTIDPEYLTALAARGCYIGLDRFPGSHGATLGERIDSVANLIERGLAANILLSHDWAVEFSHVAAPRNGSTRNPGGYRFIYDTVIPQLSLAGVSAAALATICSDNPRRFLTGSHA